MRNINSIYYDAQIAGFFTGHVYATLIFQISFKTLFISYMISRMINLFSACLFVLVPLPPYFSRQKPTFCCYNVDLSRIEQCFSAHVCNQVKMLCYYSRSESPL